MNDIKRAPTSGLGKKALLVVTFWGVAAMLMALFWVRENDLAAAREAFLLEKAPSSEQTPTLMPKITRQDFEFRLPVPGEKGKYKWKVSGRKSISVNPTTDRILDFEGEMVDRGDLINLSSPVALFDRKRRVLRSSDGVILQSEWMKTEAPKMVMDMKADHTEFSGGVTTEIDTEEAEKRELVAVTPPPGEKGNPDKTTADKPKEKQKKKSPLVITSKNLSVDLNTNRAIYTGNVVAKDDSGTIVADKMESSNFTDEEKKKNPKLKGVKTVVCTGNVKINQLEGKKQALCARAVYDARTNTVHLYHDPKTGKKVVYRDEVQKWQAQAKDMILDRNKNEVKFIGGVETVDFNPDRKGFLGFMEPKPAKPQKSKPVSGSVQKSPTGPK